MPQIDWRKLVVSQETFYVTTPIYYVNDVPHLGHAYTTVVTDFMARYRRSQGRDVFFLTGTDEHGQKILRSAEAKGLSPKEWTDQIVPRWTEVWEALDISNDDFIRTTEARHEGPVQKFMQDLYDRGEIYLGRYEGLYCVGCEAFKQPDELVDGKCPLHNTVPDVVEEENYFFRLSNYADRLIELWESTPTSVMPEGRRNEVLGKVRGGLDDLSISRVSFDWGVPVPWDDKHVIYVWIDALQNYITAVGYGSDEARFDRIWPADIHFVGKDILWFHSVIWPAMLMALELPLPKTVFAHGFLQVKGEKMSKSTLTGISPHELIETFGSDAYRYYFARDISFGGDGDFSFEAMVARYNSDLANDFGNLASRVLNMITRYLDGTIPEVPGESEIAFPEQSLIEVQLETFDAISQAMDDIAPHDALKAAWGFVRKANAYVEEVTPWKLAKDELERRRLEVVLYQLADGLRLMSLMLFPIMPRAAEDLWSRLGLEGKVGERTLSEEGRWGLLPTGSKVTVGDPLFPRIETED
ncbi:MAG: methionine--tRNA ligase [Actinobacteria bacterium]|nr:methionine--tRNA ligase [Actinomycetota bacterium]